MDLNVLPECYIDTKLVKLLVPPQKRYNHQKGTNVLKVMEENLHGDFALGIVDEDVLERKYPQEFDLIYHFSARAKLLKHPKQHHYLVCLCPAIEKWIIATSEESGLVLTEFGLPHDFDKLRKITKTSKSENDDPYSDNFRRLFKAFRDQNSLSVIVLSHWINYLKTNPYDADIDWLVNETNRLIGK